MIKITKENINVFIDYYHNLHDSYITDVNYSISQSKIELLINVYWCGESTKKSDTNKTKMKMILNGVEQCNIKEMFSWDYIYDAYIKFIKLHNKDFICFANDEEEPTVYIICDSIEYEEIKEY